ncbi:hypothetical protein D3C73_1060400 [compost metagenome]
MHRPLQIDPRRTRLPGPGGHGERDTRQPFAHRRLAHLLIARQGLGAVHQRHAMGIADPYELTARPGAINRRQLPHVTELTPVQLRSFNTNGTDRRRPESRLAQVEPETLHALDLRSFHCGLPR